MEELEETKIVMETLIKLLKTKQAVADRLGQSKQAFNKSYHYAKSFSLERRLEMKLLLNQLMAEKGQVACIPTPLTDAARLRLELLGSENKAILAHFKAVQSILMPAYGSASSFNPSVKMINTAIYYYVPLLEAEKSTHLPLRTAFIGLLSCCDAKGYFYWEPDNLKAAIFPYLPLNFTSLLEALCQGKIIEKKQIANKLVGYIPLKDTFVYESQVNTTIKKTRKDKQQKTC